MIISGKKYLKLQAYKDKKDYLIADFSLINYQNVEALCAAIEDSPTSISCSMVSLNYLSSCSQVSWKKIPQKWQMAFASRLCLPYVEFQDGTKEYRNKDGVLHKEDGPAIEWASSGIKEWYLNGLKHRLNNEPAIFLSDDNNEHCEYWVNGQKHRTNGPAIEIINKERDIEIKQWWLNGTQYTESEFNIITLEDKLQKEISNNKNQKNKVKI